MMMKGANQPLGKVTRGVIINVDHCGNAVAYGCGVLRGLQNTGPRQVSDGFRPVLITARGNDLIQVTH